MEDAGFIARIFDFSFKEFVTTKIIKVLFVLGIIVATIGALGFLISSFATGKFFGILIGLVLAPIIWFVYIVLIRVWLEIIIVLFRIAENTNKLVDLQKKQTGE